MRVSGRGLYCSSYKSHTIIYGLPDIGGETLRKNLLLHMQQRKLKLKTTYTIE